MVYLKISIVPKKERISKQKSIIDSILSRILPKANPDFDDKIEEVVDWLLEFENKDDIPVREIGIDSKGNVITKMPFKNNYGFWIDNSLTFHDFKSRFESSIITEELFSKQWKVIGEGNG